jgi:hypothetical protein
MGSNAVQVPVLLEQGNHDNLIANLVLRDECEWSHVFFANELVVLVSLGNLSLAIPPRNCSPTTITAHVVVCQIYRTKAICAFVRLDHAEAGLQDPTFGHARLGLRHQDVPLVPFSN